ncbi:MAG: hypothetical protein UW76_C0005G0014 [Parcubacteria group bacterium GW2011_GWF2_44_8b]|nr:MAG: hypothetical protein UW76_C0005G0014 [Parcubacteria group bacterium GW2011_GWF2_44_8b]
MEFNLFKIENSFNKKDSSITELKDFSSTKGQNIQNPVTINSQTAMSTTGSNDNFLNKKSTKKSLLREIFIGVIVAIITYLILGIK